MKKDPVLQNGCQGRWSDRGTIIAIILSITFISFFSCKKKETPIQKEAPLPVVGNKAPMIILKDINGKIVHLSDFTGRIVVIDFWATWCFWCRETTQELEKLHKKYKDKGVVFLGISMDSGSDAEQKVKDFAEKYNLTYRMLMDDGKASRSYAVSKIPTTFILDNEHSIVKIYPGYLPGLSQKIAGEIEKHLSPLRSGTFR